MSVVQLLMVPIGIVVVGVVISAPCFFQRKRVSEFIVQESVRVQDPVAGCELFDVCVGEFPISNPLEVAAIAADLLKRQWFMVVFFLLLPEVAAV